MLFAQCPEEVCRLTYALSATAVPSFTPPCLNASNHLLHASATMTRLHASVLGVETKQVYIHHSTTTYPDNSTLTTAVFGALGGECVDTAATLLVCPS